MPEQLNWINWNCIGISKQNNSKVNGQTLQACRKMLLLESSEGQLNGPLCLWFKGKAVKGESERERTVFGNRAESSCEWRPDSSVCFVFNSSSRSSFPVGGFTINELTGKSTKSTCNFSTLLVIHCAVNTNGITNTMTQGCTTCGLSSVANFL